MFGGVFLRERNAIQLAHLLQLSSFSMKCWWVVSFEVQDYYQLQSVRWMFSERSDPRDLLACRASKLSTAPHSQQCFLDLLRISEPSSCHLQSRIEVPHPRIMFQKQFWMRSECDVVGNCSSQPRFQKPHRWTLKIAKSIFLYFLKRS